MKSIKNLTSILAAILFLVSSPIISQTKTNTEIKELVKKYKSDSKGPYKAIRWFCLDGSTLPPDQRCPELGGVQRAQYKDEIVSLVKTNKIYLGQILAATKFEDFWDKENQHSRLKQYQIEKYLRLIDDGWVNKKAKFYRGSTQEEDEQNWGKTFLLEILSNDQNIIQNYFLIRSAAADIPHRGDTKNSELVRVISKNLSDSISSFMNLRIKIHGNPEAKDIGSVKKFLNENSNKISESHKKQFVKLIAEMNKAFEPIDLSSLNKHINLLRKDSEFKESLKGFISSKIGVSKNNLADQDFVQLSDFLFSIRGELVKEKKSTSRLALLDLSLIIENILFTEISTWKTNTVKETINKNYYLAQALVGAGNIELWEWENVKKLISVPEEEDITLESAVKLNEASKRIVEWSSNMIKSTYNSELNLFSGFEPLTNSYFDNKVRSSILLFYSNEASKLNDYVMEKSGLQNNVLDLPNQNQIKGVNPGYAKGELVVIKGNVEEVEFRSDKIYVFENALSDLKPVAGLLTVSEGNLVSHVQLLARNLGIPNASLSQENLNDLLVFSGKRVFYAVSKKGKVILKLETDMSENERSLFSNKKEISETFRVPTDKLKLEKNNVIDLRDLRAYDSGVLCGPKAANLGQLKSMFPESVVEGLVIPFGIFNEHMEQIVQGSSFTYWEYLHDVFKTKQEMQLNGIDEDKVEKFTLEKLKELQDLIINMPLLPKFVSELKDQFLKILGNNIGTLGVFLRSDTNMEDLKDFTGAGLNLTLFNVLKENEILKGINQVWASPFSERSYRWRQKILENPENVYPSILIIPSVNVDNSGVMITTGVSSGNESEITISFSRGPGGAVDGQATESYLINEDGKSLLLGPARESKYNILPEKGGVGKGYASFETSVLNSQQISKLYELSKELKNKLPNTPGIESTGPFDVELGFKDSKIWLFQVRPFVESKKAVSSTYLNSMDSDHEEGKTINLNETI